MYIDNNNGNFDVFSFSFSFSDKICQIYSKVPRENVRVKNKVKEEVAPVIFNGPWKEKTLYFCKAVCLKNFLDFI